MLSLSRWFSFFLFNFTQCFVTTEKVEYCCSLEQFFFSLIKPSMFLLSSLENQAIRNHWQKTNPRIRSSVKGITEKIGASWRTNTDVFFYFTRMLWTQSSLKVMAEKSKSRLEVQPANKCQKSLKETLEEGVKYVQS